MPHGPSEAVASSPTQPLEGAPGPKPAPREATQGAADDPRLAAAAIVDEMPRAVELRAVEIVLLFATVAGALAMMEVALRFLYPANDRHYVLAPNSTSVLTPAAEYVAGVSGPARYVTSSHGIRGPEFSDSDDYRILAVGGSTTQNVYLDQTKTWTLRVGALLNEESPGLRTWTGDVGRSGHTARSHVLQVHYLLRELPRIDALVMLVGVNDLIAALRQGDDFQPDPPMTDPEARIAQMRQAFWRIPGRLHNRSTANELESISPYRRLALYELVRMAWNVAVGTRGGTKQDRFGEIYKTWREHRVSASTVLDSLPNLNMALIQYEGYLGTIATETEQAGVRLILMTHPALWRPDLSADELATLWLGGTGNFQAVPGQKYYSVQALADAMRAFNAATLGVCERTVAECLDLATRIPSTSAVFYDDVHFTEFGSELVARELTDYMKSWPPYTPQDQLSIGLPRFTH